LNRRHRRPHAFDFADQSGPYPLSRLVRIVVLIWWRWPPSPQSTAFRGKRSRIPTEDRTPIKLLLENEQY
jgi:hypothetical protein